MRRRAILAVLLMSCLPKQDPSLPPEALGVTTAEESRGADELVRTSAVDPNRGPVTIWSVERGTEITALYVIGHAEERCCQAVSELMSELRLRPELADAWFTFGFGAFQAGKRPGATETLKDALDRAHALAAGVCAGQAILKQTTTDPAEAGVQLAEAGRLALERATQEQRPIIAYFQGSAEPMLVPIFAPGRDGAVVPLDFRLPRAAVKVPPAMLAALSLGEYLEEVVDLRESKRNLELALRVAQTREPLAVLPTLGPVDETRTAFGARLKERIGEDMARLRAIEDERQRFCVVATEVAATSPAARPWKTRMCETLRDEVADLNAGLAASLESIDAEGRGSTAFQWNFFRQVGSDASVQQAYAQMIDMLDEPALQRRHAEMERVIGKMIAHSRRRSFDPADAAAIIVDAALRGWPATFIDEDSEHEFDAWNARNQAPLWQQAFAQMQRKGVRWDATAANPLQTSTLLFRVSDTGEAYKVEPTHVLSGDYYMIADPDSRTVRFEATTTEQNLRGVP